MARDPFVRFRYRIEIEGITEGTFLRCDGLESAIDVVEIAVGGDNAATRLLPGRTRWAPIRLWKGVLESNLLWEWHQQFVHGTGRRRRNGSIVLLGDDGVEIKRWSFRRAWPSRWSGPTFDGGESDLAVEMVELSHEGLTLTAGG